MKRHVGLTGEGKRREMPENWGAYRLELPIANYAMKMR